MLKVCCHFCEELETLLGVMRTPEQLVRELVHAMPCTNCIHQERERSVGHYCTGSSVTPRDPGVLGAVLWPAPSLMAAWAA